MTECNCHKPARSNKLTKKVITAYIQKNGIRGNIKMMRLFTEFLNSELDRIEQRLETVDDLAIFDKVKQLE